MPTLPSLTPRTITTYHHLLITLTTTITAYYYQLLPLPITTNYQVTTMTTFFQHVLNLLTPTRTTTNTYLYLSLQPQPLPSTNAYYCRHSCECLQRYGTRYLLPPPTKLLPSSTTITRYHDPLSLLSELPYLLPPPPTTATNTTTTI